MGGSSLLGTGREFFSFQQLFLIFATFTFASLFLMRQVKIDGHQEIMSGMDLVGDLGS